MNDNERNLIRYICQGNYRMAEQQTRVILSGLKSQKDESFKKNMLETLDYRQNFADLPSNVKGLLVAEDVSQFPWGRFLIRDKEEQIANEILNLYRVSNDLMQIGISYLPAAIFHGESGCGKTMLAKYIAHKAGLPYVYVRFSNLVGQYLGNTQQNIAKVIDFVKQFPCVLCFDEIDAIGLARGQQNDVGEMSRIVISLMQEMDSLPNNVIIIGTTNRFDRLDQALVRRFPIKHQVFPLTSSEAIELAKAFFAHANVEPSVPIETLVRSNSFDSLPASQMIKICTDDIVNTLSIRQKGDFHE